MTPCTNGGLRHTSTHPEEEGRDHCSDKRLPFCTRSIFLIEVKTNITVEFEPKRSVLLQNQNLPDTFLLGSIDDGPRVVGGKWSLPVMKGVKKRHVGHVGGVTTFVQSTEDNLSNNRVELFYCFTLQYRVTPFHGLGRGCILSRRHIDYKFNSFLSQFLCHKEIKPLPHVLHLCSSIRERTTLAYRLWLNLLKVKHKPNVPGPQMF